MAEGGASESFASSNLDHKGDRDIDSYFHMSDASKSAARENEEEFRRVKADFSRVARQNRRRELSRSEPSRSPSPIRRRSITPIKEFAEIQNSTILPERCRVMV